MKNLKPKLKLTPEIQAQVCAFIRAGGYPHVAAEAAGVPVEVHERWMIWGSRKPHGNHTYSNYRKAVLQATAQARLAAEIKVMEEDPIAWLRSGPGKEQPDRPGWTNPQRPPKISQTNTINMLMQPELQGIFQALLQVLAPYPEARSAVAEVLNRKEQPKQISGC